MGISDEYQKFIMEHSSTISAIENALRSVSYIIPGRFADSEFAAEVLYSALNFLRLVNESAILGQGKSVGEGVTQGAWNSYLRYLKSQSPLLDRLITFLNVVWVTEVPLEMLIHRILGLSAKLKFVVILEIFKAAARLLVFSLSNWRPTLRNYIPSFTTTSRNLTGTDGKEERKDLDGILSEIKACDGKETEGLRNFLKKHRLDAYVLVPELSVTPCKGTLDRLREVSHIMRPLVYASLIAISVVQDKRAKNIRWAAWILSLSMDVFAEWPRLKTLVAGSSDSKEKPSHIEEEEHHVRLLKFFLYLLREPVMSLASHDYIESVLDTLSTWRLLKPFVKTAKSYEKLCEKVVYYTLGS